MSIIERFKMNTTKENKMLRARKVEKMARELYILEVGDHGKNVDRAIKLMEKFFNTLDEREHTDIWVSMSTQLGIYYLNRCNGDKRENGKKALKYFEMVETYYDSDFRWGKLKESMGLAYLMQGNNYIDIALDLFDVALGVIDKEVHPSYWVNLHINIARAYSLKDGFANTKKAKEHTEKAIRCLEEYDLPEANYYNAVIDKISGDLYRKDPDKQNLLNAIAKYEKAIKVFLKEFFPSQHNEVLGALNESRKMLNSESFIKTPIYF